MSLPPDPDPARSPSDLGLQLHGLARAKENLQQRDFSGADLRGCTFEALSLKGAVLTRAVARGVDFTGASLAGARLDGAMLAEAVLRGADLRYAHLNDAALVAVELDGARLDFADLQGAYLYGASGRPSGRTGARISAETFRRSKWTPAELWDWEQAGAVLVDFEALPVTVRDWFLMRREGLLLYFATPLAPVDHMMLHGVITAWRRAHVTSDLRLVDVQERDGVSLVRVQSSRPDDLVSIAEALCELVQDSGRAEPKALVRAVAELTSSSMVEQLRWLVRRGERWELWAADAAGARCARSWSVESSPQEVLETLLRAIFDDEGLRRFLEQGPEGAEVANALPGSAASRAQLAHEAVQTLARRGLIEADLFLRLMGEFPGRRVDIAHAAARWGLDLPPTVVDASFPARFSDERSHANAEYYAAEPDDS